jgi:hypothetical protein
MSIALSRLRGDVSRRFHSEGADFQDAFLQATEDVLSDIEIESALEVDEFDSDEDDTIDLDSKYYSVLLAGVLHYMSLDKRFTVAGEPVTRDRYETVLARLKADALVDSGADGGMSDDYDED